MAMIAEIVLKLSQGGSLDKIGQKKSDSCARYANIDRKRGLTNIKSRSSREL